MVSLRNSRYDFTTEELNVHGSDPVAIREVKTFNIYAASERLKRLVMRNFESNKHKKSY